MRLTNKAYVDRVLTLLNELDVEAEYSASRVRGYVEELYPVAWRRAVELFPVEWFELKRYPYAPILFSVDLWDHLEKLEILQLLMVGSYPKGLVYGWENAHYRDLQEGIGYLVLPGDFLKLGVLKLRGWRRRATVAYLDSEELSFKQANRYTRGTQYRPMCVIRQERVTGPFNCDNGEQIKGIIDKYGSWEGYDNELKAGSLEELEGAFGVPILRFGDLVEETVPVLWYYSLPMYSDPQMHDVMDFGYVPSVSELPEVQEVGAMLLEPLTYMGAVVTLEALELWESAGLVEERLGRLLVGVV